MPAYRLTLYNKKDSLWHYCQMTANESGRLTTAYGVCGERAETVLETAHDPHADPAETVKTAGNQHREEGYDYPRRKDMLVMSLHFRLNPGNTWPAGAPWFDDWKTYYQEPIEQKLTETANGFANGNQRSRGHYILYYYVLNAEKAKEAVQEVVAAAPVYFPLNIHIADREVRPEINLDGNMPGPLVDLFKGFEEMALNLAEASQQVAFQSVTLMPQILPEPSRKPIRGAEAGKLRKLLYERWGFNCSYWPPLGGEAKGEVVFVNRLEHDAETQLDDLLKQRVLEPVYLLDCEEGFFTISPDKIFRGAYEGVVFDSSLDWIIYFSHHNTITFGGDWLIEAVQEIYADYPQALNQW